MKRGSVLFASLLCICLIAGCTAKTAGETKAPQTAAAAESPDYARYIGDWSLKVSEDETLYRMTGLSTYYGSTGIHIAQIQNGHVKGSIYSISGAPGNRQANVDFEGNLANGTLTAPYQDDGWLYSGTIELTFGTDEITANITRDPSDTTPLWGIPEGRFTFLRPIQTDAVTLTKAEKETLAKFFSALTKDKIQPFEEGGLTDKQIIEFIGLNIGTGTIDTAKFGSKIKSGANITFDESVMNDLSNQYFGMNIKTHPSSDSVTYKNGVYTVPALGGVSESPVVQMLLKDTENKGTYYAIVDYISETPDEAAHLAYQYLINLQKPDGSKNYTIKSIQEAASPIDFNAQNAE